MFTLSSAANNLSRLIYEKVEGALRNLLENARFRLRDIMTDSSLFSTLSVFARQFENSVFMDSGKCGNVWICKPAENPLQCLRCSLRWHNFPFHCFIPPYFNYYSQILSLYEMLMAEYLQTMLPIISQTVSTKPLRSLEGTFSWGIRIVIKYRSINYYTGKF